MPNRVTKLVRELQNSEEERKRRWLFGLSAVTMLVVITLWLSYLNLTILSVGGEATARGAEKAEDEHSFATIMKRGTAVVYHEMVHFFERQSRATNEFEIKRGMTFQKDDLPAITPREIK